MSSPPVLFDAEMQRKREPFAFNADGPAQRGLLCVHGFTGSPYEVRPLGEYFAARGWRVSGPLLPGHGRLPEALRGMRWGQWFEYARSIYDELAATCDEVYVAGLSMGGLIALHLAAQEAHNPASKLCAIAALATPAGLIDKRTKLVHVAHPFVRWFRPFQFAPLHDPGLQARVRKNFGSAIDFDNPTQLEWLRRSIRIPLNAVSQLLKFNDAVLRELGAVQAPVYVAQGDADGVVACDSAEVIHGKIGAAHKVLRRFAGWQHELPLEDDAVTMFDEIAAFFAQQHRAR